MAPPSQLSIATKAVLRLVKEEASYKSELVQQAQGIEQREKDLTDGKDEDGNGEFMLNQLRRARDETKAIFKPLQNRIREAVRKLEAQVEGVEKGEVDAGEKRDEELKAAQEALGQAKATLQDAGEGQTGQ